jgi:hypothetical protein
VIIFFVEQYKHIIKMATFVPTLSITANGSSHTTPGPFSFALSLTKTDTITVNGKTTSESGALITTTHTDNKIFDQSAMGHAYIYISNPSDREIFLCSDDEKNWRITQLPNGYYQTEVNKPDNSEEWVDITRRETMEGAEAAINGSVEHFEKKLEYIKGPKVVKTFK